MGTLYLVATPIGNLGDLSPRAETVLAGADRILAEDTRRTRVLTQRIGAQAPMVSLHGHNERSRTRSALAWLEAGESVALVSDAGTPLVSDPGRRLVREAAAAGNRVVPIPGPSAILAALVSSGLASDRFVFAGFPPRKGPRRSAFLDRVRDAEEPVVLFESPKRLVALLADLTRHCGPGRGASVARELTKLHEEVRRGRVKELEDHYRSHPPRGEVSMVVAARSKSPGPAGTSPSRPAFERPAAAATAMLDEGLPPSGVARALMAGFGLPRNEAYRLAHARVRRDATNDPEETAARQESA